MNQSSTDACGPQLTLTTNHTPLRFRAFEPGYIGINQRRHTAGVLIFEDVLIDVDMPVFSKLSSDTVQSWALRYKPELILIGTGAVHRWFDQTIYDHARNVIGLESMDTDACIRTLVALQSEPRRIMCYLSAS